MGLTNLNLLSLVISSGNVFAGTDGDGVFVSTDNGGTWKQMNTDLPANLSINCLSASGINVFAGAYKKSGSGGVFYTTNNGANWIAENDGFTPPISILSLALTSTTIYAGTEGNNVWTHPEIVNVNELRIENGELRIKINPNPVSQSTVISYQIPENSVVSIKVFDITGREIETLINEDKTKGDYTSQL